MGWEYISADCLKVKYFSIVISDGKSKITCSSDALTGPKILNLGIKHDIFSHAVTGVLHIEDSYHIFEKLNPNLLNCDVKIIDSCTERTNLNVQQCTYHKLFRVVKVIGQPDRDGVKILYLVDSNTMEMSRTFQGGSYKNKTTENNSTANFFKNVLSSLGIKSEFSNFHVSENDRPKVHKLENNASLSENLQRLSEECGYFMFPTGNDYFLGELSKTNLEKNSRGLLFTDCYNPETKNLDYIGLFFDSDVIQSKPMSVKTMIQLNDGSTTYVRQNDVNNLDLMINNNDEYKKSQETYGSKQGGAEFVTKIRYQMQKELLQQNHMRIYVPCSFYYDEIGQIVEVKKKSLSPNYSERLKGDETLSGNWIIKSSNYVLTNEHKLITIIDLIRFDNPKVVGVNETEETAKETTEETKEEKVQYTFIPKFNQLKYDFFEKVFDNFITIRNACYKVSEKYNSKVNLTVLQNIQKQIDKDDLWVCEALLQTNAIQNNVIKRVQTIKEEIVTIKNKGGNYTYGIDIFKALVNIQSTLNSNYQVRSADWLKDYYKAFELEPDHYKELNKALSDYDEKLYKKAISGYTNPKTIDTAYDSKNPDISSQEKVITENGFNTIDGYSSNPENENLIIQHCKLLMRAYE